jgi:hypothetical protein
MLLWKIKKGHYGAISIQNIAQWCQKKGENVHFKAA